VSAQRKLYFSSVEFRPKPGEPAQSMHLGWLLEFTTAGYWVVGLAMRAVLDREAMARLDPLSRELLENRAKLFEADIDQALRSALRPGDVLSALSRANPWSVYIGEPMAIPAAAKNLSKGASIDQVLEQYILTLYQRALAADKPVKPRAHKPARVSRAAIVSPGPVNPIEPPPPWMLPARHWARPLVHG
jgi:hypothetical protein